MTRGLAETGRTLEDVLRALGELDDEANAEISQQVRRIVDEGKVTVTVKRMQAMGGMLRSGRGQEARTEASEIAGHLELLAGRLDSLHRSIVAPRLEALIALEKRAAALQGKLKTLDSQEAITRWHHEAAKLTEDLADQSAAEAPGADLLEAMHGEGWADGYHAWNWDRTGSRSYYIGPAVYDQHLTTVVRQLQEQVRELLLADLISAEDEAVPPQYEQLVQRYFQILSRTATEERSSNQHDGDTDNE